MYDLALPEEKDDAHAYALRRALMHSSFFEEGRFSFFLDRVKFAFHSRRAVASVTIALVLVVGAVSRISIDLFFGVTPSSPEDLAENISEPLQEADAQLVKSAALPVNDIQENTADFASTHSVQFLSQEEMEMLLKQVYSMENGTLMVEMPEGDMYVYSFNGAEYDPSLIHPQNDFSIASSTSATPVSIHP